MEISQQWTIIIIIIIVVVMTAKLTGSFQLSQLS